MTRYPAYIITLALIFTDTPAAASAWVMAEGETKVSLSHEANDLQYRQSLPSSGAPMSVSRKARQDSLQINVEYGLSDKWTLTGKGFESTLQIDATSYDEWQVAVGLRRDAPILQSSLMPPFLYRLIEGLCQDCQLHRDRVASLELTGRYDQQSARADNTDLGLMLSLADKVLINRFSVMQQIQWASGGDQFQQWHKWSYRFEVGLGAQWQIGQVSEAFWDRPSDYANLSHGYYVEWRQPVSHMSLVLLIGSKRDSSQPHAFDSAKLEWRKMF